MRHTCKCERCKTIKTCTYYGSAADVDAGKAQNGEWLCDDCVEPRQAELDEALAKMKKALDAPMTPRVAQHLHRMEQLGSRLRDATEQDREEFIQSLVEDKGLSEADARDWVRRLIED